ncbi:hypothetical protein [Anaeromyxobacter sp. SG17]|uniref:hypothetical protein n=1 Tax=Anaeromyxobacter sp. SG17 TaxID=2925405 RepID=UPI001F579B74|nr:hypothetical protein [Anaeromyxobacter sp. SG17]
MRPLAIILVVAALGAAGSARAERDGPSAARAGPAPAAGLSQEEPQPQQPPSEPPPASGETYVTGDDRDFEPEVPARSLALGPVPRGGMIASLDLGWLRSGLRADIGLASWLNLVLRADSLLLYERFGGQNGIYAGLRTSFTPQGTVRGSAELTVGQIFVPADVATANLTAIRGSVAAGLVLDWATFYGRADVRWLSGTQRAGPGWVHDAELGVGVERAIGRFILGAEGFVWARPGLSKLGQWRLRAGFAI